MRHHIHGIVVSKRRRYIVNGKKRLKTFVRLLVTVDNCLFKWRVSLSIDRIQVFGIICAYDVHDNIVIVRESGDNV